MEFIGGKKSVIKLYADALSEIKMRPKTNIRPTAFTTA
ncbi:MAG: hypothetical protein UT37_C0017G0020 [Parcubacteria group bacterium GW2011_GWA2_39_18]|nr:MAG: hypothetical protein UT37_C0017G0020 [Parcubacteria group bacterium GW2011_GWA2_39_18]